MVDPFASIDPAPPSPLPAILFLYVHIRQYFYCTTFKYLIPLAAYFGRFYFCRLILDLWGKLLGDL
jgi:hypothetical protein